MPGIELEAKYKYLFDLYTNFDDKKNKYDEDFDEEDFDGANYVCGAVDDCGDNCDFFFIVGDCGNLVMSATCPWCKSDIGWY